MAAGSYDPDYEWGHGELACHLQESGDRPVRYSEKFVHRRLQYRYRQAGVENAASGNSFLGHADNLRGQDAHGADYEFDESDSRLRSDDRQGNLDLQHQRFGDHGDYAYYLQGPDYRGQRLSPGAADLRHQARCCRRVYVERRPGKKRPDRMEQNPWRVPICPRRSQPETYCI